MKVALAQIDTVVGDVAANAEQVRRVTQEARAQGAELVVFPEQTLPGYPARDLLELPEFVARQEAELRALAEPAEWNRGIGVVVGFAEAHGGAGAGLHNAAALLDGGIRGVARKMLLPNYDVFDEARWFDPAPQAAVLDFRGTRIGLSICEDIWNDKQFWAKRRYVRDPVEEQVRAGAELLINVSASPFSTGKPALRARMLAATARHHGRPVLYVNQVGGQDALVFDGHSTAFAADGSELARAAGFAEGLLLVDTAAQGREAQPFASDPAQQLEALVVGTRGYARKTGFKSAVIGLSGGVDSALVAVIAVRALGAENVTTLAMPSRFTADISNSDADVLARNLGIRHEVVPIEPIVSQYEKQLSGLFAGTARDVTEENLQARSRGGLLMAFSNKFGALLLTTGNKSEMSVGYCTLYGDMCGGLAVIGDLLKTEVYAVCRHINLERELIPERILTRAPSAELRENQTDQDSLPPYDELDRVLRAWVVDHKPRAEMVAEGMDPRLVERVVKMVIRAEYKRRQSAPVLRVSQKAFGEGWRFPIAQGFR